MGANYAHPVNTKVPLEQPLAFHVRRDDLELAQEGPTVRLRARNVQEVIGKTLWVRRIVNSVHLERVRRNIEIIKTKYRSMGAKAAVLVQMMLQNRSRVMGGHLDTIISILGLRFIQNLKPATVVVPRNGGNIQDRVTTTMPEELVQNTQ